MGKKNSNKTGQNKIDRSKDLKNIADEPEMIELKRMIRSGELDPERTSERLKGHT